MARLTRRTFLARASRLPLAVWLERYWGRLFCLIDVSSGTDGDSLPLLSAKVPVDSGVGSATAPVWSGPPSSLSLLQGLSVSAAYASGPIGSGVITYSIAPGSSQSVVQLAAIGVSLSVDGIFFATSSARIGIVAGLQVRATRLGPVHGQPTVLPHGYRASGAGRPLRGTGPAPAHPGFSWRSQRYPALWSGWRRRGWRRGVCRNTRRRQAVVMG